MILVKEEKNNTCNNFILRTLHRQNLVQSYEKLTEVVNELNEINRQISIVMPAHPRFKRDVNEFGLRIEFNMIESVEYLDMIAQSKNYIAVITDSGGLQKSVFLQKACIPGRNELTGQNLYFPV